MKDLLSFILTEITGNDKVEVAESNDGNRVNLFVTAPEEVVGLIIGKEGKTIKSIRKILSIRATTNDQIVNISVNA